MKEQDIRKACEIVGVEYKQDGYICNYPETCDTGCQGTCPEDGDPPYTCPFYEPCGMSKLDLLDKLEKGLCKNECAISIFIYRDGTARVNILGMERSSGITRGANKLEALVAAILKMGREQS